jgi:NADPH:quinone reductase-like Zn-dependent oxidoreductase
LPEPQRGEVLLKIHAVSLNRRDLLIVQGDYPGPIRSGLIPCSDAAGEVVSVGDDVTDYKPGDQFWVSAARRCHCCNLLLNWTTMQILLTPLCKKHDNHCARQGWSGAINPLQVH